MARLLCRVEGVNFGATVFDTNDLSTIRGASLALLALPETVSAALPSDAMLLYAGASQCAHIVDTALSADALAATVTKALAAADGPLAHLTTVVDVVAIKGGDEMDALNRAEARNHARQFRQWTLDPLPFTADAKDVGALEGARPGTVSSILPKGKGAPLLDPEAAATGGQPDRPLSEAVNAKRRHGSRKARQGFFTSQLAEQADAILGRGPDRLAFTDSLQDMVEGAPATIPPSARGKVAVVYADGNAFGKARKKAGVEVFSRQLGALRKTLLKEILRWFAAGARTPALAPLFAVDDGAQRHLRLETLLWGGDEALFAMPSWLALPFARGVFKVTEGWSIEGQPLTHAMGIVIADRKTPIRQLTALAHASADLAKAAGLNDRSSLTVDVFESLAPPDEPDALGEARETRFGTPGEGALARVLAFPATADDLDTLFKRLGTLKGTKQDEGFPRSQIYAALRAVTAKGARPLDPVAEDLAYAVLNDHDLRTGQDAMNPVNHRLPAIGGRPLAVDLVLLTTLWDYLHFEEANPPAFPEDQRGNP